MARAGKLQRHYTLNIDGLSEAAGLTTWHPTARPSGMLRNIVMTHHPVTIAAVEGVLHVILPSCRSCAQGCTQPAPLPEACAANTGERKPAQMDA